MSNQYIHLNVLICQIWLFMERPRLYCVFFGKPILNSASNSLLPKNCPHTFATILCHWVNIHPTKKQQKHKFQNILNCEFNCFELCALGFIKNTSCDRNFTEYYSRIYWIHIYQYLILLLFDIHISSYLEDFHDTFLYFFNLKII